VDTVLITGANRGIGLELAKQYAADGWRVLACARRSSPGLAGLAGLHSEVQVCPLDVSDHGQIDRLALTLQEARRIRPSDTRTSMIGNASSA
jgi:NAD(P)-dependent dehydrogenase (short-subunit alcohol dehydrogenase family)